jgi:hypothetical protein
MYTISMSSGAGSSLSTRRPDSMRCQARGASALADICALGARAIANPFLAGTM